MANGNLMLSVTLSTILSLVKLSTVLFKAIYNNLKEIVQKVQKLPLCPYTFVNLTALIINYF